MTTEEMQRSIATLREMQDALVRFDEVFRNLKALKAYADRDFAMMHFDHNAVQGKQEDFLNSSASGIRRPHPDPQHLPGFHKP
jgi:hypothetical protein